MPGNPSDLSPEAKSAVEAWVRETREATDMQRRLTLEVTKFSSLMGSSGINRGILSFSQGLSSTVLQMGKLKNATMEQQIQLHGLVSSLGSAVAATTSFLTAVDSVEKKQGSLQKAYGITNISMKEYYTTMQKGADIGGVAGVKAAESVIQKLLEQRSINIDNKKLYDSLTNSFVLYTTALSENFPTDFVKMQEQLGMGAEHISDVYAQLGYDAANARVPFEQYKNTVMDTTAKFVQYGVTIEDVRGTFSLFMDDVANRTLTMAEAAAAVANVLGVQKTAGGLQKRAMLSHFVSEDWQNLPAGMQKSLDAMSNKVYDNKQFGALSSAQKQFVMASISSEDYTKIESEIFKKLQSKYSPEKMLQISEGMFTGGYFEMMRRSAGVTTGAVSDKMSKDEFLNKTLPDIAKAGEEWYSWGTKLVLELKKFISDLSPAGKAIFGAGAGLGGFAMNALPQALMLRYLSGAGGQIGTGGAGGGVLGAGAGAAGSGLLKFASVIGLATTAVGVWGIALSEIEKQGGFSKLADDITYWRDRLEGTRKEVGSKYDETLPDSRARAALEAALQAGFMDEALKMMETISSLKGDPALQDLYTNLKKAPGTVTEGEYGRATPGSAEFVGQKLLTLARSGGIPGLPGYKDGTAGGVQNVGVTVTVEASPEFKATVKTMKYGEQNIARKMRHPQE